MSSRESSPLSTVPGTTTIFGDNPPTFARPTAVPPSSHRTAADPTAADHTSVEYIGNKPYICVDHRANVRKGSKVSWVWEYGREYRSALETEGARHWRCNLCNTLYQVDGVTSPAIKHLRKKHKIIGKDLNDTVLPTSSTSMG